MLGKRVKELLEERGWTQSDLARAAEMHRSEISEICTGRRTKVNTGTLERLARGLGIPVEELLKEGGEEPKVCRLMMREIGEAAMWELLEVIRKIKKAPIRGP
ncbi:MAG: hypothetical protein VR68_11530 [Peptococcaceae bacterium BRH_c4a]|nr:MAG: hypothetical protein VR68_11530 [Peptococcaceae bacterium BRH_c4a]